MDCVQRFPKPELLQTIVDVAAKYFEIDDDKEKCNLQFFFDFYASVKMKENIVKAFSNQNCCNS